MKAVVLVESAFRSCENGLGCIFAQAASYTNAAFATSKAAFNAASSVIKDQVLIAGHEIHLLEEGLVHIGSASPEIQSELKRDAVNCAVETGLTIAEDIVAPEITVVVAALEVGEKMVHTPAAKINFMEAAVNFTESIFSSAAAAVHSAANIVHDLELSGMEWERSHSAPNLRAIV